MTHWVREGKFMLKALKDFSKRGIQTIRLRNNTNPSVVWITAVTIVKGLADPWGVEGVGGKCRPRRTGVISRLG
jgi:hypothetical protein